jgi:hypothetical protein
MSRNTVTRRSAKIRQSKVQPQELTVGDLITAAFDALGNKHRVMEVLASPLISQSVGKKLVFVSRAA